MKKEKSKHTKSKSKRKIKQILLVITFIISTSYLIYYFYNAHREKEKSEEILNEVMIDTTQVTEEKTERMIQLEELQKENQEIIGWLEIEGTNINSPVLQTDNNDFYLTHNYKKEKASTGSLFLDKDFDWNKPSTNYLIYGHRNKQGLAFEDLMKYTKEDFYKEHQEIKFTTTKEDTSYEIISAFYSRVYYKNEKDVFRYYYFINAENEEEYNNFVNNAKKVSLYDTGVNAEYGEQLLTLSTCSYHIEDGRFVIVAKKK